MYLVALRPTYGHSQGDSLIPPMLITALLLVQKVTCTLVTRSDPKIKPIKWI